MRALKLDHPISGATHFVRMKRDERPPVEVIVRFARQHGAAHKQDGQEIFLVKLCDEEVWCGMNRYTLKAGLSM